MAFNLGNITRSRMWLVGILFTLLLLVVIAWVSLSFAGKNRVIDKIEITIEPDTGLYFVSTADISGVLAREGGNPTGKTASEVNLGKIENAIKKLPFVAQAQVYLGLDGILKINVKQRIPVLHITNLKGESYFLDTGGYKIPDKGGQYPDVLPATGQIAELIGNGGAVTTPLNRELLAVGRFISSDPLWNAMFEQCYVDKSKGLLLIPRLGKHTIVLGNAENLPEKFSNLRVFYEKGVRHAGWDKYSVINLRYRGQIVCEKNVTETEHIKDKTVQNDKHQ